MDHFHLSHRCSSVTGGKRNGKDLETDDLGKLRTVHPPVYAQALCQDTAE